MNDEEVLKFMNDERAPGQVEPSDSNKEEEDILQLMGIIDAHGIDYPKENLGTPIGTITLKDDQLFIVPLQSHELIPLNSIADIKKLRTIMLMQQFAYKAQQNR
jgi:hypothetical protein